MSNWYRRIQRHLSDEENRAIADKPDLILHIGEYEAKCHALIVTKASPVLEALCRWENGHDTVNIAFKTHFGAADLVIKYIYGYKLAVPEANLPSVLRLSKFLLMDELTDFCISLIKEIELRVTSCLKTLFICSLYDIDYERLVNFIRGNLTKLLYTEDMLYIDEPSLRYLLCDETLTYLPRFEWLRFVVQWCKLNTKRKALFPNLLKLVDLYKIRRGEIKHILQNEDLLEELPQCKEYYDQAIAKDDSERAETMVLISSIDHTFILDIHTGSIYKPFLKKLYRFQNTAFCNGFELGYVDMAHMKVYIGGVPISPEADCMMSMEIQRCKDEIEMPHIFRCLKNDDVFVILGKKKVTIKPNNTSCIKRFQTIEIYMFHEHDNGELQAKPFLSFRYDLIVKAALMDSRLYLFRIYEMEYYVHLIFLKKCRLITQEISSYFKTLHNGFYFCIVNNEDVHVKTDKMKVILNADTLDVKRIEYFDQLSGVPLQIDNGFYYFSTHKRRIEYMNHSGEKRFHAEIPLTEIGPSCNLKVLMPITIDQTGSLCHVKCPHCDPEVEESIRLLEEDEIRREREDRFGQQNWLYELRFNNFNFNLRDIDLDIDQIL